MQRFCSGDTTAFDALFERLAPQVKGFLTHMVRDRTLAEDLLQTTFLSVVRSRDRYQTGATVAPWIFAIAANAARDALRHQNLGVEVSTDKLVDRAAEAPMGDPGLRTALEKAFAALPEAQREAVLLHKVHGLTFEQIAESLGTSPTAVRIRAHRGYERLRSLLAHLES
jgi:RNA polymerase sigma-70 factor (ECF subfamily)